MRRTDRRRAGAEAAPQRRLILEALIEVAAERGYLDTTVEAVLERAGLERGEFDRHFRGKYDCFLTAWREINEECLAAILKAYESAADWPDRLRAVAETLTASLRDDPARASFGVEVLAAGDAARARRDMTMRVVASLVDAGRQEMEDPETVSRTTAEALTGAAYGQIYAKIVRGAPQELPALVPQLVATLVMPYLGLEAAAEELRRGEERPASAAAVPVAGDGEGRAAGAAGRIAHPEPARLPPGSHGLPREFVAGNQRDRLIAGLAEAVAEHGYNATTVAAITKAAGVSRRTFYENFADRDECFVAAYDAVMDAVAVRVAQAFAGAPDWPHGVREAIAAMLRFFAAEPALARLGMVEAMVAGPVVVERYDATIRSFLPHFRDGGGGGGDRPRPREGLSPNTEEAVIGGMVSLVSRRILTEGAAGLESLLPDLVVFVLTPYLGDGAAREIAGEDLAA